MINQEKMEASSNSLDLETIDIKNLSKFLGFTLPTTLSLLFYKLNFESTEKSLREMF